LTQRISTVDDKAMTEMKEQLSAAIGEAMLVRIEVDRIVSTTEEKIGKNSLRMAEIEALLVDELDVSASVQLERLEELERALVALDPDQFVRKTDMNAGSAASRPSTTSTPTTTATTTPTTAAAPVPGSPSTSLTPTLPSGSSTNSTEPSLSSF
ncbi:MAG: hypothetical protein KAY11_20240, partial [Ilumatobacteraceae bacterium]|nr:hypothetical protein [Ilumatobacteraceae bacterium]